MGGPESRATIVRVELGVAVAMVHAMNAAPPDRPALQLKGRDGGVHAFDPFPSKCECAMTEAPMEDERHCTACDHVGGDQQDQQDSVRWIEERARDRQYVDCRDERQGREECEGL